MECGRSLPILDSRLRRNDGILIWFIQTRSENDEPSWYQYNRPAERQGLSFVSSPYEGGLSWGRPLPIIRSVAFPIAYDRTAVTPIVEIDAHS